MPRHMKNASKCSKRSNFLPRQADSGYIYCRTYIWPKFLPRFTEQEKMARNRAKLLKRVSSRMPLSILSSLNLHRVHLEADGWRFGNRPITREAVMCSIVLYYLDLNPAAQQTLLSKYLPKVEIEAGLGPAKDGGKAAVK